MPYRIRVGSLLILMAVLLGACDAERSPMAPTDGAASVTGESTYRLVHGDDGSAIGASMVIGPLGGRLSVGGHTLRVPADAVSGLTTFTMMLTGPNVLSVDLTATSLGSTRVNDVGSAGFLRPLTLAMSYSRATRGVDLNSLTLVHTRDDGTLEVIASEVVHDEKAVKGSISHFSGYAIADRTITTDPTFVY